MIIFIYSAINIIGNIDVLYSILNTDTSSDSLLAKSNGGRWVSAIILIIHDKFRAGFRLTENQKTKEKLVTQTRVSQVFMEQKTQSDRYKSLHAGCSP